MSKRGVFTSFCISRLSVADFSLLVFLRSDIRDLNDVSFKDPRFIIIFIAFRFNLKMGDDAKAGQKAYHKKATGAALNTVKKHVKDQDLKLFGSCFWYVKLIGDATWMAYRN